MYFDYFVRSGKDIFYLVYVMEILSDDDDDVNKIEHGSLIPSVCIFYLPK